VIEALRNVTAREWIRALESDRFRARKNKGSHHLYQHPDGRRVLIVYHKLSETFGPKTIKQIQQSAKWVESDLRRLRLLI